MDIVITLPKKFRLSMFMEKLFDISLHPPTDEEISDFMKKRKRVCSISSLVALGSFLLMCFIDLHFVFQVLFFFIFLSTACLLHIYSRNRYEQDLSASDREDILTLLSFIKEGVSIKSEQTYVQRVIAEGREFRAYEVDMLIKRMKSRSVHADHEKIMMALSDAVNNVTPES